MSTITLIGLGPGDPMLLTRAAWEALNRADTIFTPTPEHPALEEFRARVRVLPSGPGPWIGAAFTDPAPWVFEAIEELAKLAQQHERIYTAWSGVHAESQTIALLHATALQHNITLHLLPDVRHELQPLPVPPQSETTTRAWSEMQPQPQPYSIPPLVPADPLHDLRSFDALRYVTMRLLGPGGCPWDVKQTHQSLRGNLLEEVYEVLEALDQAEAGDAGSMAVLCEELGDLLFQVFVHSEMARQGRHFDIGDVLEQISSKLIRRHPHVFADLDVTGEQEVMGNWEQIKAQELAEKGRERSSALDGIPPALPALAACQKIGHRAAKSGFDWPTLAKIRDKLREELDELEHAYQHDQRAPSQASRAHLAEEVGDALYALVQVARWLNVDAESALREANAKFRRRFIRVEQAARERGRSLHDLPLAEKVALWQAAKQA